MIQEKHQNNEKTLFRVENIQGHGMWYNNDVILVPFKPIDNLNRYSQFNMDYNQQYHKNGTWLSACGSIEELNKWFNKDDLKTLLNNNFIIVRLIVKEWGMDNNSSHPIFKKDSIIEKRIMELKEIYQ